MEPIVHTTKELSDCLMQMFEGESHVTFQPEGKRKQNRTKTPLCINTL